MRRWLTGLAALAALVSGAAWANPQPWEMNMPKGVTPISHQVYSMHMLAFWVCVGIGVVVFTAMIIALFRFRKSKGAVAETWSGNMKLEVVWTVIPIILLIILSVPASGVLVNMADMTNSKMTVKVTGYQWLWRYDYVDYQGKPVDKVGFVSKLSKDSNRARQLGSDFKPQEVTENGENVYLLDVDKPLVVPTKTKIRFMITGGDVIHSWWVPEFGFKKDAIPGVINAEWATIEKPGIYRGQCAELCGQDHAYMPIVVKAVPPEQFQQWLAAQESESQIDKASRTVQVAEPQPSQSQPRS